MDSWIQFIITLIVSSTLGIWLYLKNKKDLNKLYEGLKAEIVATKQVESSTKQTVTTQQHITGTARIVNPKKALRKSYILEIIIYCFLFGILIIPQFIDILILTRPETFQASNKIIRSLIIDSLSISYGITLVTFFRIRISYGRAPFY